MGRLADAQMVAIGLARARQHIPFEGLKPSELQALVMLGWRAPLTSAILGSAIGSDKSHVSRTVAALIQKGHIEFQSNLEDKRKRLLNLSAQGRKLVDAYNLVSSSALASLVDKLDQSEAAALELLAKFFRQDNRLKVGKGMKLEFSQCTIDDLTWLASQKNRSLRNDGHKEEQALDNAFGLIPYLNGNRGDFWRSWIVRDWGERAGGCVLCDDPKDSEGLWIKLLHYPHESDVLPLLLEACITRAQQRSYRYIRYSILSPEKFLEAELKKFDFQETRRTPITRGVDDPCMRVFWERKIKDRSDPERFPSRHQSAIPPVEVTDE